MGQELGSSVPSKVGPRPPHSESLPWGSDASLLPQEWKEELERLATEGGTVLLLGGSDAGKSTFCRILTEKTLRAGAVAAVVDADLGQSSLGLPGTVTTALYDPSACEDWPAGGICYWPAPLARKLFFVGSVSPRDCPMNHLVATVRAAQAAWETGAKLTVIDTTGYISMPEGALLKRAKIDTIRPDVLVALAHRNELQCITGAYSGSALPRVVVLPPSPRTAARKREARRKNRQERFREHFRDAQRFQLSLSERVLLADFPLEWRKHRPPLAQLCAKTLGYRVAFATSCGDTPLVVTEVDCTSTEAESLTVALKTKPRTYSCEQFQNCLVGLVDEEDEPLGVGLLLGVEWQSGCADLLAPPDPSINRTRVIKLGRIRIDTDGTEVAPANW